MARLIDAEGVLRDKVWFCGGFVSDDFSMGYMEALDKVETVIRQAPTVDAVPVVRCKDCRHSVMDVASNELWCNHCKGLSSVLIDTDFCSYGERRTNEAD